MSIKKLKKGPESNSLKMLPDSAVEHPVHARGDTFVEFSHDGKLVFSGGADNEVHVFLAEDLAREGAVPQRSATTEHSAALRAISATVICF